MPLFAILILAGIALIIMFMIRYMYRHAAGPFWIGYVSAEILEEHACRVCDGYGIRWLVDGKKIPVPEHMRLRNRDGTYNRRDVPPLANLSSCLDCGGVGSVMVPVKGQGDEVYHRLPFPWPWRTLGASGGYVWRAVA